LDRGTFLKIVPMPLPEFLSVGQITGLSVRSERVAEIANVIPVFRSSSRAGSFRCYVPGGSAVGDFPKS
jgi:hypothetical protein